MRALWYAFLALFGINAPSKVFAIGSCSGAPACEDWCDGCRKARHGITAPHRARTPGKPCEPWTVKDIR